MESYRSLRFVLVAAALTGSGWAVTTAADSVPRLSADDVVRSVGERVAAYYRRAQQLVCIERSTTVPITRDWTLGFARVVESDLRVELAAIDGDRMPEAQVTRHIRSVNGREPRERDKKDRSGCTDPTPISPEPLEFLLPGHRDEYRFTSVRDGHEAGRPALVIDFASMERRGRPELIEDAYGHDDCFDWKGPLAIDGRLWIDPSTYDVLRLDRRVAGPTDVRVPDPIQRKYQFSPWLTLERDDLTLRYKPVAFHNPDETVLLPASEESMTVFRTSLQSMRHNAVFSDYQRFLTDISSIKIK
jgi:hypothetical protein